jgi:hypothetical protein
MEKGIRTSQVISNLTEIVGVNGGKISIRNFGNNHDRIQSQEIMTVILGACYLIQNPPTLEKIVKFILWNLRLHH